MSSPRLSNDYISETRRGLLLDSEADFVLVPGHLAEQAASMIGEVAILSRAWTPSYAAKYDFVVTATILLLRVRYASPGGPLELRSEGTAVLHVLERPEPVTPAVAVQLAHAMFGEYTQRGDVDKRQWSQLSFQPPDAEGTRFFTWILPGVPEPPPQWPDHRTGFFGGLITDHRIELVSLYSDPRWRVSSKPGPRAWSDIWMNLEPWKAAYAAAKRE